MPTGANAGGRGAAASGSVRWIADGVTSGGFAHVAPALAAAGRAPAAPGGAGVGRPAAWAAERAAAEPKRRG